MMVRSLVLSMALSAFALAAIHSALCFYPAISADGRHAGRHSFQTARLSDQISIRASDHPNPLINLADGRDLISPYSGADGSEQSLGANHTRPLALTSADLDEDGMPDLVSSYAARDSGLLVINRGNIDSLFPNSAEARQRKARGEFAYSPLLSPGRIFPVPETPRFIASGDFDADGHPDIVSASSSSNSLYLLRGDGRGDLGEPQRIELPGAVTAMTSGDIDRPDGLLDLAVAIRSAGGPQLLKFESPLGALRAEPETISLPEEATAVVPGQLDEDYAIDLAVAAGRELILVGGRDRRLSLEGSDQFWTNEPIISSRTFPYIITSLAAGNFVGDWRSDLAMLSEDGSLFTLEQPGPRSEKRRRPRTHAVAEWQVREVVNLPPAPGLTVVGANVSSLPYDDLIAIDQTRQEVRILTTGASDRIDISLIADSAPVAALAMRLNADGLLDLVVLRKDRVAPTVLLTAPGTVFSVNSTADPGVGTCDPSECTLREAIAAANANAGPDAISFNIIGAGPHTINLTSPLPTITGPVAIDGTSEPDFVDSPVVELNGTGAGNVSGLNITGGSSSVKGLAINRFTGSVGTGIELASAGNFIEGNFIGTDITGELDLGNNTGVSIKSTGNTIGGTSAAARNVISGNTTNGVSFGVGAATGNFVLGNFIGTDKDGVSALGNSTGVLVGAASNTIGGTAAGARNVISGNAAIGVHLNAASAALVQGNLIGTGANGATDLGNNGNGISIAMGLNNTIGGTTTSARNVISGNTGSGIRITGNAATTGMIIQGNFIGTDSLGALDLGNNNDGVDLAGSGNTVGGTVAGAGNLISGNNNHGVQISSSTGHLIAGNLIGTDASGAQDLGNSSSGIMTLGSNHTIGGVTAAARNVISGNTSGGVTLSGSGNKVQGNFIGTGLNGTDAIGNGGAGVAIGGSNHMIGGITASAGNRIAFNSTGVVISSGIRNSVLSNFIFSNTGSGLDLAGVSLNDRCDIDTGVNNRQNSPVLISAATSATATTIQGSLSSATGTTFTIQFFSNSSCDSSGNGEGQTLIGSATVTTDSNCTVFFNVTLPVPVPSGNSITATATDPLGNTSEFSGCITASCLTNCAGSAPVLGIAGTPVPFTGAASFSCAATPAFEWSFGDSTPNSTLQNPSHTYTAPGVFTWTLTVRLGGSTICTRTGKISVASPLPAIDSFSPAGGPFGSQVTISGRNFTGATQVRFNGLAASFNVNSPTRITATVPSGATSGPIAVQTPGGTATSTASFIISSVRITVNSSADTNTRDNLLTLREAILIANGAIAKATLTPAEQALVIGFPTGPSLDAILFEIGTGAQSIAVGGGGSGPLPVITGPVIIDATTQDGFGGNPLIELNGTGAGLTATGLRISAGNSTVRGLVINRFGRDGILLHTAGNNLIEGNFIGTGPAGSTDLGNGGHGVSVINSNNNLIGGAQASARNIISGNDRRGVSIIGDRNRVQGNFIGVGSDGATPLGNSLDGVGFFGSNNTIGARLELDATTSGLRLVPEGKDSNPGNTIAFNGTGVRGYEVMQGGESTGNSILSNEIHSNQDAQIRLNEPCPSAECDNRIQANDGQPAPILESVTFDKKTGILTIVGSITGSPNTNYFLQFFNYTGCPGGTPSGNPQLITTLPILQLTNALGSASFTIPIPTTTNISGFVNSTATDPENNTSPLSACAQVNGGCSFSIMPTSLSYPEEGGMSGVTVLAGTSCNWTATSNSPDFITITSGSSGSGLGTVLYSVAANLTLSPRSGTMTIAGQTFTVDQNAQTCSFMIAPMNQNFSSDGGTANVTVTAGAGCAWTAVSNNPDFIRILSPVTGGSTGNGSVSLLVETNTGQPRMGTLSIAGQTFTVSQDSGCSFSISPTTQSFSANAGNDTITVTTGPSCNWTAVSNNPGFISITSGANGSGSGAVTYSVAANASTSPRSGTIIVAGQTFTVTQGAAFLDVPQNHPFFTEIGKLSSRGVTLGCGGGNYCPDQPVLRDQMAAFIIRARGELNPPAPAIQRFPDVPPNSPFYAFVDRMAELQITLGCGGGNYCPGQPVLRDQMAAFIIRGLSIFNPPPPAQQRFMDVPPTNFFFGFIEEMALRQITLGCGAGVYCPSATVTRGQMAAFLVRAFGL